MQSNTRINSFGTFLDTLRGNDPSPNASSTEQSTQVGSQVGSIEPFAQSGSNVQAYTVGSGVNEAATQGSVTRPQDVQFPNTGTPMIDLVLYLVRFGPQLTPALRTVSRWDYKDFYATLATCLEKGLVIIDRDVQSGEEFIRLTARGEDFAAYFG